MRSKKIEINNEFQLDCSKFAAELVDKKARLKETCVNEVKTELVRNQKIVDKTCIESKKSPELMAKSRPAITCNKSLVTTRSNKKQAVPKLRPRRNGIASPVTVKAVNISKKKSVPIPVQKKL